MKKYKVGDTFYDEDDDLCKIIAIIKDEDGDIVVYKLFYLPKSRIMYFTMTVSQFFTTFEYWRFTWDKMTNDEKHIKRLEFEDNRNNQCKQS